MWRELKYDIVSALRDLSECRESSLLYFISAMRLQSYDTFCKQNQPRP
jgi:hypothetical protein